AGPGPGARDQGEQGWAVCAEELWLAEVGRIGHQGADAEEGRPAVRVGHAESLAGVETTEVGKDRRAAVPVQVAVDDRAPRGAGQAAGPVPADVTDVGRGGQVPMGRQADG